MYSAAAGQPGARPAPRRPRLGAADIALYLWRAKWLMLLVFLPLFALGLLTAISIPVRYTAEMRLLASASELAPAGGQTAASELDLMRSLPVVHAALDDFSGARLYPAVAQACDGADCQTDFTRAVLRDFEVSAAPGSQVIRAAYKHPDPVLAKDFLRALSDAYIAYRPGIMVTDPSTEGLEATYIRLQAELAEAETAIRSYSGGAGEQDLWPDETIQQLITRVNGERLNNAARLSEVRGQLAAHRRQLRNVPEQHDLFVDDVSEQRLQELYLEREEWRARLAPDSVILQDLNRRIERAEIFLSRRDEPAGMRRRGANPLYQEVQAAILRLEAEAEALIRQQAELDSQLSALANRRTSSSSTPPEYSRLVRRRDVAEIALEAMLHRDAGARLRTELAGAGAGGLRILEPATITHRGEGLRILSAGLALLIAALAALITGLAYAFSRRAFATARSIERTFDMPVLASVPVRKGGT